MTSSTMLPASAETAAPICCPEALEVLREAFREFFHDSQSRAAWDDVQQAVERLSPADPQFTATLDDVRQRQSTKHGGFTQRYVLGKDVGPDGELRDLPRPIPVRDDTRKKLSRLVRSNPERFPGGIQQLYNEQRPLQQAKSLDYATLIKATIRCELNSLLRCDRTKLLKGAATLLDLADAYRHMRHVGQAHPKVVETIDQRDTSAIIEFLVTVGSRTPLTERELLKIVPLASQGWKDASEEDLILRGRVLQTGLEGKSALLKSWVEPFAAEIMFCGMQPQVQQAFRKRLAENQAATVRPNPGSPPKATPVAPSTTGTFSAPLRPAAPHAPTSGTFSPAPQPAAKSAANLSDTAPVKLSTTDAFKIPIGVPEPPKLQVLRNYLRVSTSTTSMRLSEAMRLAEARDDVAGHRLYVQQVFHEGKWAITGQTRGDPIFSRMNAPDSDAVTEG